MSPAVGAMILKSILVGAVIGVALIGCGSGVAESDWISREEAQTALDGELSQFVADRVHKSIAECVELHRRATISHPKYYELHKMAIADLIQSIRDIGIEVSREKAIVGSEEYCSWHIRRDE